MKFTLLLALSLFISYVFAQSSLVNTTTTTASDIATSTISSITPTLSSNNTNTISSATSTATFNAAPPVQSNGFNPNGNQEASDQESWLKKHNRFVFIIFVGLIILGLLIWYVVRSVKGMRKRLEQDNAAQLYMMQQATNGYQHQQQQQHIPESIQTPPPAYKTRENTPMANNTQ